MAPPHSRDDLPENSRVFVVSPPGTTEEMIRNAFEKYGTIEDVWFVKSRRQQSNESTVLLYVKYSKSSEALLAIENLNGSIIEGCERPIKAVLAASREGETGPSRGMDGTDYLDRLFLLIREDDTEKTIRNEFEEFGHITDVLLVRNKFAYVSYKRPYEAALAIEAHDAKKSRFRPRIAEKPGSRAKRERSPLPSSYGHGPPPARRPATDADVYGGRRNGSSRYDSESSSSRRYDRQSPPPHRRISGSSVSAAAASGYLDRSLMSSSYDSPAAVGRHTAPEGYLDVSSCLINNPTRCTQLFLKVNYPLTREMVFKVCNLIPNLDYVDLHAEAASLKKTIAFVRYKTAAAAALAWQRLQDLEYPPGFLIRVRYADAGFPEDWKIEFDLQTSYIQPYIKQSVGDIGGRNYSVSEDYRREALAAYSSSQSARGHSYGSPSRDDPRYETSSSYRKVESTVRLRSPQPMLPKDLPYADRCYFTLSHRLSQETLEDIFSSFGNLIEVYYLKFKNCGYALFGSKDSAAQAIETLDGQWAHGELFNVVRAEPDPKHAMDSN